MNTKTSTIALVLVTAALTSLAVSLVDIVPIQQQANAACETNEDGSKDCGHDAKKKKSKKKKSKKSNLVDE
jgi:hypothetical protein